MKLKEEEIKLILSCLESDTQGTWKDSRGADIAKLIRKIKEAKQ
jgi:hypothetical protein